MGNLGAEKAKNQGLGWQQDCGGGALVKAPGEKWGKMGEMGRKWGEMGDKWGRFRLLNSKAVWRPCLPPLCPC